MPIVPPFQLADFHKSRRSQPDRNCVFVARSGEWTAIRDGKTAFGSAADTHLVLPAAAFTALRDAL